jgi:hypothetical protein
MKQVSTTVVLFTVCCACIFSGCGKNAQPLISSPVGTAGTSGAAAALAGNSGAVTDTVATAGNGNGHAAVGGAGVGGAPIGGATAPGTLGLAGASGSPALAGASAAPNGGGTGSGSDPKLEASIRNPMYPSLAPPLGEPFPNMTPGAWTWTEVAGALSRDGSPAGLFYKFSKTGSKNLLVYMAGGGVCADGFFCNMNPANKNESLTAENVGTGVLNILGPDAEAQDPTGERWQSGIFKDDPMNPARDWNMVFIPYVTGDVFFGSKPNGTVPDVAGMFQFVGKANMQKFIGRTVATFKDAQIAMISGSSAGGIGALLNATYFADAFIDQGRGARIFVLDDAGPFFDDQFLEVCIQKRYRDLYGLDESFPMDCSGCRTANGGGLVKGTLGYLADKYPSRVLGGFVDSDQDEIMKFFFSEGLQDCAFIENPIVGLGSYPADRYPAALKNMLTELVDPSRMSTYVWSGDLHQNLFQTATDDRFYNTNGLDKTVAEWFAGLISGKWERIGVIK